MATSFTELKKNRKNQYEKILQETKKMQNGGRQSDDRFWNPTLDKAGNGTAVIRFLPPPQGEDLPYVWVFSHGFKGPTGMWYIENSLTTLNNQQDPVGVYNSKLWKQGEAGQQQAREQKRTLSFYSNIYVVKDVGNPDNEGKVFLFRYGKKIFDKINDALHPNVELGEEKVDPFDLWDEGANFNLIVRTLDYRNYDKSYFARRGPLLEDDDKLEEIWKQCHSLADFTSPDKFKTYAELQAKLNKVMGFATNDEVSYRAPVEVEEDPPFEQEEEEKPVAKEKKKSAKVEEDDDDDQDMDFFNKLLEED